MDVVQGCIAQTLNSDDKIRIPAESKLLELENQPGFCRTLLLSYLAQTDINLRIAHIVLLKNAVGKLWRMVDEQEKSEIKNLLLVNIGSERDTKSDVFYDLTIARVARNEWPNSWPELFRELTQLTQGTIHSRKRSVRCMLAVVKELNTKRLGSDRLAFRELAGELIGGFLQIWMGSMQDLIQGLGPNPPNFPVMETSDILYCCCKMLYLLLVNGWTQEDFGTNQHVRTYLDTLLQHQLHDHLIRLSQDCSNWQWCLEIPRFQKYMVKAARYIVIAIVDIQKAMPVAFVPYLYNFLPKLYDNSFAYIRGMNTLVHRGTYYVDEKLGVQMFTFLSNVVDCPEYRETQVPREHLITLQGDLNVNEATIRQGSEVIAMFFNRDRVMELIYAMVMRAFALSEDDINNWVSDPEEYAKMEEELTASMAIRPACESLLTSLIDRFNFVPEMIATMVSSSEEGSLPYEMFQVGNAHPELGIPPTIIIREAVFRGVGLCAYWLHGRLNFTKFTEQRLFPILRDKNGPMNILRRRVLWLIGCTISDIDVSLHAILYETLVMLLEDDRDDLVVRLKAAETLQSVVNAWDFSLDSFSPVLTRCVQALLRLSMTCETPDCNLALMQTLLKIIERTEGCIVGSLDQLMNPLNQLWMRCDQDPQWSLWKISTMEVLVQIIVAVGESTRISTQEKRVIISQLQTMLIPLIYNSTESGNPDFVYLAEPATRMLCEIVKFTTVYSAELHGLFPRVPMLIQGNESVLFGLVIEILQSYILVSYDRVLSDFGESVLVPFIQSYLLNTEIKARDEAKVIRLLELVVMSKSSNVPQIFGGILSRMTNLVRNSQILKSVDTVLAVGYLTVLARFYFEYPILANNVDSPLVDAWIEYFDSISNNPIGRWRKKLWACVLMNQLSEQICCHPQKLEEYLVPILHDAVIASRANAETSSQITYSDAMMHLSVNEVFAQDRVSNIDMKSVLGITVDNCKKKMAPDMFSMTFGQANIQRILDEM